MHRKNESFPGALVLEDLKTFPGDVDAARWIIVRYAAVRAIAALMAPVTDPVEFRIGRSIGLNHVRALPMLDREAWSLRHALDCLSENPTPALSESLLHAGRGAETRMHMHGAYAIFQMIYHIGRQRDWHGGAAAGARGAARIAQASGSVYSPRLWQRRAKVMEMRTAVA